MQNKISVLIRLSNEERWIGYAVQSVIDIFNKPEIIIINNYSTDRSLEIVKRFSENPKNKNNKSNYTDIKIINIKDYSPGRAVNLGVKKAKNKTILVLSAHCIVKQVNLKSVEKNLKKYVSVFGNQIPVWEGKKITKRYIWQHFGKKEIVNMYSNFENRYFLHNAFAFFNKSFLLKNKFDENLEGKEDRYWAIEMISKKKKGILYDPNLVVEHQYTPNGATWKGIA